MTIKFIEVGLDSMSDDGRAVINVDKIININYEVDKSSTSRYSLVVRLSDDVTNGFKILYSSLESLENEYRRIVRELTSC